MRTVLAIFAAAALLPMSAAQAMDKTPSPPPSTGSSGGKHPGSGGSTPPSGSPTAVSEPGMIGLFGLGVAGIYAGRRLARRRERD